MSDHVRRARSLAAALLQRLLAVQRPGTVGRTFGKVLRDSVLLTAVQSARAREPCICHFLLHGLEWILCSFPAVY